MIAVLALRVRRDIHDATATATAIVARNRALHTPTKSGSLYLLEEGRLDPLENVTSQPYDPYS